MANCARHRIATKCSATRCNSNGLINQGAEIDHYQPLLFIVDSFDHLFGMVDRLEHWMREGKLYNVAPGLPEVHRNDLRSFMDAGDAR